MSQLTEERKQTIAELRKALLCLYTAVPSDIADDVKSRAEAVISLLDSDNQAAPDNAQGCQGAG